MMYNEIIYDIITNNINANLDANDTKQITHAKNNFLFFRYTINEIEHLLFNLYHITC